MAKTVKFTKEEVGSINQLRTEVSNVFTQLGQIEIEKQRSINEIDSIQKQLIQKHSELQQKEQELFKGLNDKYGDGNYDPATGEFTPTTETTEASTK